MIQGDNRISQFHQATHSLDKTGAILCMQSRTHPLEQIENPNQTISQAIGQQQTQTLSGGNLRQRPSPGEMTNPHGVPLLEPSGNRRRQPFGILDARGEPGCFRDTERLDVGQAAPLQRDLG